MKNIVLVCRKANAAAAELASVRWSRMPYTDVRRDAEMVGGWTEKPWHGNDVTLTRSCAPERA